MATVLIIDDNELFRESVAAIVRKMGHVAVLASHGEEGMTLFAAAPMDLVLSDFRMEGADGLAILRRVLAVDADAVVVLVSGFGSVKLAVEALKSGAFDFVEKPLTPGELRGLVNAGLERRASRRAERLERPTRAPGKGDAERASDPPAQRQDRTHAAGIRGKSPAMMGVFRTIEKVAPTDSTVFIQGESGTGKELVARAIHDQSARREKPFVGVNCAAIPQALLETELFGHEKGSFTGAVKQKIGRFEQAHEGTLFLDEIGDLPLEMQAKLLRALQEKQVQRVGGEGPVAVDVRIVSATHRDIGQMVKAGTFREDLYFRLHIIPIVLPPLRERPEDIEVLAQHFLDKLTARTKTSVVAFDDACLAALQAHRWPGNVRELENVLEQALVFCDGDTLSADDLPPLMGPLSQPGASVGLPPEDDGRSLDEILESLEKALILRAYQRANRVKTETARLLGLKTSALYYKLEKYKIV